MSTAVSAPLVVVEAVHTFYGKSHILHGVSIEVGPGEVVGLLGRNGVGKSTTLKTIMGLVQPSQGSVRFDGETRQRVWAPYYTIHKIMAGLLDAYLLCGNAQALEVLRRQAAWVKLLNSLLLDTLLSPPTSNTYMSPLPPGPVSPGPLPVLIT